MKVHIKWNRPLDQIANSATGGDRTRLFMANEAKRLMQPYVPALNMGLDRNVRTYVEGKQGIVEYMQPYARFQFYGKLMVSSVTGSAWARHGEKKVVVNKDLTYTKFRHPMATSRWDKAMLAARGKDFADAVETYNKRGG